MWRALVMVAVLAVVAGCGGGTPPSNVGPSLPGGRTPQPSSPSTTSAATIVAPPSQPSVTVGPGGTVADLAHAADLLSPADFAAAGVSGAGTPTTNPSGNANYIVYKGLSAADGGIELDIFLLGSSAEAATDFGGVGMYALDPAVVQEIGADQAGYYPDQPGNTAGVTFSEIRVLKGKAWFDLSVPSGPQAQAQLIALAQLVLIRGAALFG